MGFFGEDRTEEIEDLKQQISDSEAKRKKLSVALAEERKRVEALRIDLGKVNAELATARRAVAKARGRQKASVERANRFKTKLDKAHSPAQVS